MKIFQCGPGNKKCGKRCVPNKHKCKDDKITEKDKPDFKYIQTLATAAGAVVAVGVAISVFSYVKTDKAKDQATKSRKDLTLGVSPADFDFVNVEAAEVLTRGITEIAKDPEFEKRGGKFLTGDDILNHDELNPNVKQLLIDRKIDLSNVVVVEFDSEKMKEAPFENEGNIGLTRYFSKNNSAGFALSSKDFGTVVLNANRVTDDALNHELIHIVQRRSGWVISDERYTEIVNKERYKVNEGEWGQINKTYANQKKGIQGFLKKSVEKGILTKEEAEIAGELTTRLEFEAWWIANYKNYGDLKA